MEINTNEDKPKNIWNSIAARALRTGAHIPTVEEEFDFEKAMDGLAWNFGFNRRQHPRTIELFSQALKDGTFAVGTPLRIAQNENGDWVLVDGQHRLLAIAESKIKKWMSIVVDERPAHIAYSSIDNIGSLRKAQDAVSSMLGWSLISWTKFCSAGIIIAGKFSSDAISRGTLAGVSTNRKNEMIAEVLNQYKDAATRISKFSNTMLRRGPSLAVYIVAAHYAPDLFWPYFEAVMNDDMLPKNSPEKRTTETLQMPCRHWDERLRLCYYTIACWNAAYSKKELPTFPRVTTSGERITRFPGILGTPFGAE